MTCSLCIRSRRLSTEHGADDGNTVTRSDILMSLTFRRRGGVDGRSSICGYDTPRAPFFHQYARLPADDFVPAPAHSHHNKPPQPQDDTALSRLPFVYNAITSRGHPQLRTRGTHSRCTDRSKLRVMRFMQT